MTYVQWFMDHFPAIIFGMIGGLWMTKGMQRKRERDLVTRLQVANKDLIKAKVDKEGFLGRQIEDFWCASCGTPPQALFDRQSNVMVFRCSWCQTVMAITWDEGKEGVRMRESFEPKPAPTGRPPGIA